MRLRLSCVNSGKYNATFFYSAPPDRVEEIYRQRLPPNQYTIERVNVLCVLHRSARTSVKNLLDFRLREDEEALEKGRKFLLFFSPCSTPLLLSWTPAGGVIRTQTITERRKIKWDRIMCTREKEPEGSRSLAHGSYSCRCRFVQKCFVSRIHARTRQRLSICVSSFLRENAVHADSLRLSSWLISQRVEKPPNARRRVYKTAFYEIEDLPEQRWVHQSSSLH